MVNKQVWHSVISPLVNLHSNRGLTKFFLRCHLWSIRTELLSVKVDRKPILSIPSSANCIHILNIFTLYQNHIRSCTALISSPLFWTNNLQAFLSLSCTWSQNCTFPSLLAIDLKFRYAPYPIFPRMVISEQTEKATS